MGVTMRTIGEFMTDVFVSAFFKGFFNHVNQTIEYTSDGHMNNSEVISILKNTGIMGIKIETLDQGYDIPKVEDVHKFLELNIFRNLKYYSDVYDCDKYAFSLFALCKNFYRGYAIGVIFLDRTYDKHCMNFFIDKDKQVWLIEPQDNTVTKLTDTTYKPYFALV